MDLSQPQPHRCPKCNALVVDRRSSVCTTCRKPLPADWIMTPGQAAKTMKLDAECRAEHTAAMKALNNPWTDPSAGI
jgi:hypothetical protein